MIKLFTHFSGILLHSTLVTLACALTEYILRRSIDMKLITKLVKHAEYAALHKAATLLARDDVYDEMFFTMLRRELNSTADYVLRVGDDYIFARKSVPVRRDTVTINEIGGRE